MVGICGRGGCGGGDGSEGVECGGGGVMLEETEEGEGVGEVGDEVREEGEVGGWVVVGWGVGGHG